MRILLISDTHNQHRQLTDLPDADVIVHCGDFSNMGAEEGAIDFLDWFIGLPYPHKIFVAGNHDLRLLKADFLKNLPDNVHFLLNRGCEIQGVKFFGIAYNHPESLIPEGIDILVTHEPPVMILDESQHTHWGNVLIRNRVLEVKPKYHLFGHVHDASGTEKHEGIIFYNGSLLDDSYKMCHKPKLFIY